MADPLSLIRTARLVELTQQLVSIPSVTGNEQRLSDWLFNHFRAIGLQNVQRLPVAEAGDTLVGRINGLAEGPGLLLAFHMDTFDVFDGWQSDPFTPTVVDNRLYGLGSHDMKGGAACLLGAVEALIHSGVELHGPLIVAATTDEENWSRGAHAVIQSGLVEKCMGCLIPEPCAPGTLIVGARGRHVFHLQFQGKTVHAAYTGGVNALADAAHVAHLLSTPGTIELGHNAEFDMSGSLCVIGMHSGGTLILVPERAELYIDRHILPGETVEDAAAQIHAVVEQANIRGAYTMRWDERPTPAPTSYVVAATSPPVQTVRRNLSRHQNQEIRLTLARSVADTNHFAVHGGIPTLICGPHGGNTCEANEYVCIDSLAPIAATYVQSALDLLGSTGS